jgi:hypothetical protein
LVNHISTCELPFIAIFHRGIGRYGHDWFTFRQTTVWVGGIDLLTAFWSNHVIIWWKWESIFFNTNHDWLKILSNSVKVTWKVWLWVNLGNKNGWERLNFSIKFLSKGRWLNYFVWLIFHWKHHERIIYALELLM